MFERDNAQAHMLPALRESVGRVRQRARQLLVGDGGEELGVLHELLGGAVGELRRRLRGVRAAVELKV